MFSIIGQVFSYSQYIAYKRQSTEKLRKCSSYNKKARFVMTISFFVGNIKFYDFLAFFSFFFPYFPYFLATQCCKARTRRVREALEPGAALGIN